MLFCFEKCNNTKKKTSMSIFDRFFQAKAPKFNVTQLPSGVTFQTLINQSNNDVNYYDQYILYTYRCIELIADALSEFKPYTVDQENKRYNSQLQQDLQRFNPYQTYSEARKLKEIHLRLTGVAFWVLQDSDISGNKKDFYFLDPTKVTVKTNQYGLPEYYEYIDGDGRIINFGKNEIIYFRRPNPTSWFEGYSQVEPLKYLLNAYALGSQMNQNRMLNGGAVDYLLYFEHLSVEERDRVEQQMRAKYTGTRNSGRFGVVTQKPEKINLAENPKDLDYVEGMKMLRQDILAMFGVPEALMFPSSTNSNSKDAIKIFQQYTIKPSLTLEADTLNEQLIPIYRDIAKDRVNYSFIFDNPVDQDKNETADVVKKYVEAKIVTTNEARAMVGLPHIDGLDNIPTETKLADENIAKTLSNIDTKIEKITKKKNNNENLINIKALKTAISQENRLIPRIVDSFHEQLIFLLNKFEKVPTLSQVDKLKELDSIMSKTITTDIQAIYTEVSNESNLEVQNDLKKNNIKKWLEFVHKKITPQAIEDLGIYINETITDINQTTRDQIKKISSRGLVDGIDIDRYKKEITHLFNTYIDGAKNIEVLEANGLYIESIEANGKVNSSNRYNAMLERITQNQKTLTAEQYLDSLKALKGLVDITDPVGATVDRLLTSIYKVDKFDGITEQRVTTIARTTATYVRNTALLENYKENPFVNGKKWLAVGDARTRHAHARADGQVVPIDSPFIVDGEKLTAPGIGGSPENTINCRCRIVASIIDN